MPDEAIGEIERETGHKLSTIVQVTGGYLRGKELSFMYSTADAISPRVLVEIGACTGTSSTILGSVAKKHRGMLHSIEAHPLPMWYTNMLQFGVAGFTRLIQARSPQVDLQKLPFTVIDYLLIDGDHRFEGVLADYRFWSKLVRTGGRVAFHDYYSHIGVRQALEEIQKTGELVQVAIGGVKDNIEPGLIVFEKRSGGG